MGDLEIDPCDIDTSIIIMVFCLCVTKMVEFIIKSLNFKPIAGKHLRGKAAPATTTGECMSTNISLLLNTDIPQCHTYIVWYDGMVHYLMSYGMYANELLTALLRSSCDCQLL